MQNAPSAPKSSSLKVQSLLELAVKHNASDLHLSPGHPPIVRVDRILTSLQEQGTLSKEQVEQLAFALLNDLQREQLAQNKSVDFSYRLSDVARFRVNVYYQQGSIAVALRLIPTEIETIEELNLPKELHRFTEMKQGFILITGPSSHGKSTTMASLLDEINRTRREHIITIEDPIEYVFTEEQSIIHQREVLQDTLSFAKALRAAFRQDPDIIMVGEMRDAETMATALAAAETGHLVFATLHTNSASQTVHRIVDSFPSEQQEQIRSQLAASLSGIISQRLIPRVKGGLIPAVEILFVTPAVGNLIRENKIHELPFVVDTSAESGMISLDRALARLVQSREITLQYALAYANDPDELRSLAKGA